MTRENVRCGTRLGWISGASLAFLGPGNPVAVKIQNISNRQVPVDTAMLEEIKAEAAMLGIPENLLEPPLETATMIDSEEFYQQAVTMQQEADRFYQQRLQQEWFG